MRHAGNFNPEWGYLAPAPSFLRTARLIVVVAGIAATASGAVVFSMVRRPAADELVAARTLAQPLDPAPMAGAAPSGAQLQKQAAPTSASATQRADVLGAIRPSSAPAVADAGTGPAAGETHAASSALRPPIAAALAEASRMTAAVPPAHAATEVVAALPETTLAPKPPIKRSRLTSGKSSVVGASVPRRVLAQQAAKPTPPVIRNVVRDDVVQDDDSLLAKTIGIKDHVVAVTQRAVSAVGVIPSWIGSIGDRIGGEGQNPHPPASLVGAW